MFFLFVLFFRSHSLQAYIILGVFMGIGVLLIPTLFLIYYYSKCCKNRPVRRHDGFMDYVRLSLAGSSVATEDVVNTSQLANPAQNSEQASSVFIQDETAMAGPSTAAHYIPPSTTPDSLKKILQRRMKQMKDALKHKQTPQQLTSLGLATDTALAPEPGSPNQQLTSAGVSPDTTAKVPYTAAGGSAGSSERAAACDREDGTVLTYGGGGVKPDASSAVLDDPPTCPYSYNQPAFVSIDDNHPPRVIMVTSTPKKGSVSNVSILQEISQIVSNIQSEIEDGRKELTSTTHGYQSEAGHSQPTQSDGDPSLLSAPMAVASLGDKSQDTQITTQASFSLQPSPVQCLFDQGNVCETAFGLNITTGSAEAEFTEMAQVRGQTPDKDNV